MGIRTCVELAAAGNFLKNSFSQEFLLGFFCLFFWIEVVLLNLGMLLISICVGRCIWRGPLNLLSRWHLCWLFIVKMKQISRFQAIERGRVFCYHQSAEKVFAVHFRMKHWGDITSFFSISLLHDLYVLWGFFFSVSSHSWCYRHCISIEISGFVLGSWSGDLNRKRGQQ